MLTEAATLSPTNVVTFTNMNNEDQLLFLQEYLLQIVTVGYDNAPFERDACVAAAPYT